MTYLKAMSTLWCTSFGQPVGNYVEGEDSVRVRVVAAKTSTLSQAAKARRELKIELHDAKLVERCRTAGWGLKKLECLSFLQRNFALASCTIAPAKTFPGAAALNGEAFQSMYHVQSMHYARPMHHAPGHDRTRPREAVWVSS